MPCRVCERLGHCLCGISCFSRSISPFCLQEAYSSFEPLQAAGADENLCLLLGQICTMCTLMRIKGDMGLTLATAVAQLCVGQLQPASA